MGKRMTTAGVCPWCQSAINLGAEACKACGASERDRWEQAGIWRVSIIGLFTILLTVPGICVVYFFPVVGTVLLVLGIGGLIAVRKMMKGNRSWVPPGGRSVA